MERRNGKESIYVSIQTPAGMLERKQQAIDDVNGLVRWIKVFGPVVPATAVKLVEKAIREIEKDIAGAKAA